MEEWKIATGGAGLTVCYMAFHHLRSVNNSLKALLKPMENLQKSIGELNVNMATVIADRHNDRELIDELRKDVKQLQSRDLHANTRHID